MSKFVHQISLYHYEEFQVWFIEINSLISTCDYTFEKYLH